MSAPFNEVDFTRDDFSDILAKDKRYSANAYAFLMDVFGILSTCASEKGHVSGEAILDEFKEFALDQYGPLAYRVLTEWGVRSTEDIGEMMFNLAESHRIRRDPGDSAESFAAGYDFEETFLGPYAVD